MPPGPKLAQNSPSSVCSDLTSLEMESGRVPLSMVDRKDMVGDAGGLQNWGYPGYLTEKEYQVFCKFREEVYQRDEAFQQAIFTFAATQEIEEYALW